MPDGGLGVIVRRVDLGTRDASGADRVIELAHRESGGTEIALLWCKEDARLTVSVIGSCPDDSFELEAAESSALDVFYHPYAYAARRKAASSSPKHEGSRGLSLRQRSRGRR